MSYFQDVVDFHQLVCGVGTPPWPETPGIHRVALRLSLMDEEHEELRAAIAADDHVEIADACADLVVVVLGTAAEYGIPLDKVWAEVHRSNMAKAGGPVREDGKRLKPEGWTPPDIASILWAARHTWGGGIVDIDRMHDPDPVWAVRCNGCDWSLEAPRSEAVSAAKAHCRI